MKKASLGVLLLFFGFAGKAQYNETIRTARPGIAIGPFAVGKNVLQIQSGVRFGGFNEDQTMFTGNFFAPISVFRFGITEHIDLNTAWQYRAENFEQGGATSDKSGLSISTIGARINLYEGKNHIPAMGLQLIFQPNMLSDAYNPDHASFRVVAIAGEKLGHNFSILANISAGTNGNTNNLGWQYALSLDYNLPGKWRTYIETYGALANDSSTLNWDTGLAYLVNNDLSLDLFGGIGSNNGRVDYFASAGVSWRYVKWRKQGLR